MYIKQSVSVSVRCALMLSQHCEVQPSTDPGRGMVGREVYVVGGCVRGTGAYHYQHENNTTSWLNLKVETYAYLIGYA